MRIPNLTTMCRRTRRYFTKSVAVMTLISLLITSFPPQGIAAVVSGAAGGKTAGTTDGWAMPYSMGRITEASFCGSDTVVVNVQDLHCHPEVQRNIGKILNLLDQQFGLAEVYVEGNVGRQDTSWIHAVSDKKIRSAMIEAMVDSGKLTGPEYYSIQSGKPALLNGLESEKPYIENVKRLRSIIDTKDEVARLLSVIDTDLAALRDRYYSPANRRFEQLLSKNRSGAIGNVKLYRLLMKYAQNNGISRESFPAIDAFVRLNKMQGELNYRKVGWQLNEYVMRLKNALPYTAYQALMAKTGDGSRLDEFYAALCQVARDDTRFETGGYKDLSTFFRFIELNQQINPLRLVQEEKRLTGMLHQRLARSRAEREALFIADYFVYLTDYLNNRISAEDYAYLNADRERFQRLWSQYLQKKELAALQPYVGVLDEFYSVNTDRNRYFLQSIFSGRGPAGGTRAASPAGSAQAGALLKQAKNVVVMVTGGFHTRGMGQLLKAQGVSYVVITPNVTQDTGFAQQVYDELARAQGEILTQTLRTMSNWQELGYASASQGYAHGIAVMIDGNFLGNALKIASRQEVERAINEMLSGVRKQHDKGAVSFRLEKSEGDTYHYVIRLGETDYRFSAHKEKVAGEGVASAAAHNEGVSGVGKGVIGNLKSFVMERLGLRKAMEKRAWKADASYDNFIGPVIEEVLFTAIPMLLPAPFALAALVASRLVFMILHVFVVSEDGTAEVKGHVLERLAMPLLISTVAVLASGNILVAIAAHIVANALVVPALQAAGIRAAKAVLNDTEAVEQCRANMLGYYTARKELIDSMVNKDASSYGAAYDRLLETARSIGNAVRDKRLDPAEVENVFDELQKQGAFDRLFIPGRDGKQVLGPRNEVLNAAGGPFTADQDMWIKQSVDEIINAFPEKQREAVKNKRLEIISNTLPYSAKTILPTPDEVADAIAQSPGKLYETAMRMLDALSMNTSGEGNYFTLTSSKIPKIVMSSLDNEREFKGIYMHEIGHYLVRQNIIDNAQTEIVTHAISSLVHEDQLSYAEVYRAGLAWGSAHRGEAVTMETLERVSFDAIVNNWQVLGFPSLQVAMQIPVLMQTGQIDPESVQRLMGAVLGGILQGQCLTANGKIDRNAALRSLFVWSDTVMAEATADIVRFRPDPARRAAIVRDIQRELRNMTGNPQLRFLPIAQGSASKAAFTQSADGNIIYYIPELLDHPDEEVSKALFYEQVFLLLYSQPLYDDAYQNSYCLSLYAALELSRTRSQGVTAYGGLRSMFAELNKAMYPNVHSESSKRRMNGLPLFVQFVEALLYQGRTGEKRDPRVEDKSVVRALEDTEDARRRALLAESVEQAKEILLKEIWENKSVQELITQDQEQAAQRALEREVAQKRALEEKSDQDDLQQIVQEMLSQMSPEEREELMEEAREQMRQQMGQMMQDMGQGNGQAQQSGRQMQNEAQQEALESMEQRLDSAGNNLDNIKQDIGQMENLLNEAGKESESIGSAAQAIGQKSGMKPIEKRDLANLQQLLEEMKKTAERLEKESSSLRQDTSSLDRAGKRMDEQLAPSAGDVKEQAGSMDTKASQIEKDVQELKNLIERLEEKAAKMGQPGKKDAVEERVGATELKKGSNDIDSQVKEMEQLSQEISRLMDKVRQGIETTGNEIAQEKARQQQEQQAGGSEPGQAPEAGDTAKDISEEVQRLMEEARQQLTRAARAEGDPREQTIKQAQALLDQARKQLKGAQEEAAERAGSDAAQQGLADLDQTLKNAADQLGDMQEPSGQKGSEGGQQGETGQQQSGRQAGTGMAQPGNESQGSSQEGGQAGESASGSSKSQESQGQKGSEGGQQGDTGQQQSGQQAGTGMAQPGNESQGSSQEGGQSSESASGSSKAETAKQNDALRQIAKELKAAEEKLRPQEASEQAVPEQDADSAGSEIDFDALSKLAETDSALAEQQAAAQNSALRNRESEVISRSGRENAEAREFFEKNLGIGPRDAQTRTLRKKILKALAEVENTEDVTGVRIGDELDEGLLHEARTTGHIQKIQDADKGKPSQATIFVMDTSGSMGNVNDPSSHMYKAARVIVRTLLAHVGIKGVYVGACIYGDEKSDQMFSLISSDKLTEGRIKALYDIISRTGGSTNDTGTLEAVVDFIKELAKPAVQRLPDFAEGMSAESLAVVRGLHEKTRFNVIHITDGEQATREPVRQLYRHIRGDKKPVPVKIATWGVGTKAQNAVAAYKISEDESAAWGEYAPEARAFQSVDQFENEVEDAVTKFYREKTHGRGLRSFGNAVLESVIPQAFNASSPFAVLVRTMCLEIVNRYLPRDKALKAEQLTPSVISVLIGKPTGLAQELLLRLFSGPNGTQWLTGYESVIADAPVIVSRAPLGVLMNRPDTFALASIDDAGRVIVHQSVMNAIMVCGPPEQGREVLRLLIEHETREKVFVGMAADISANNKMGEVKQKAELKKVLQALRKEYGAPLDDELLEQEISYLFANPQHAYEVFHAVTDQRYAPLFAMADGIVRAAVYRGDLKTQYLGITEEQGVAYLHLFEPGMPAPLRIKVNGSSKSDERLIKLYVKSAGRWEPLDPRHYRGSFPSQLGYSLPGSTRIRNFKFTSNNIAQLITMAKVYNRPINAASNLLLAGHPGTGKNTLAYMMMAMAAKPMRMMSMQPRTTQSDLVERTVLVSDTHDLDNVTITIDGKETVVSLKGFPTESTKRMASEMVLAALEGETVILDEVDKINFPEELTALNAFLARTLPSIHPDFRVIAITNDFKELDESTRSRFTKVDFEYMSENDELEYIMGTVFRDMPEGDARAAARENMRTVVKLANELRNAARRHEIERFFTTRAVISLAEHYLYKPEDFRYFRTVLEKVFNTDERLIANDAADMVSKALAKYEFKINGTGYKATERLPGEYDTGGFEYVLRAGKVYCALGKGPDRVEVLTHIAPAGIETARQALNDQANSYFFIKENMVVFWEWMKETALGRDFTVLGPSGTGKTELIKFLMINLLHLYPGDAGKGFADHYTEVNQRTQGRHLVGVWDMVSGKTVFVPSGLVDAMKTGVPYFIDEVDKCPPEEICALNNIAEFRQITLPNGEVVNAAPGFFMVKAGNFNHILTADVQDRSATFIMRHLGKDSLLDFLKRYRDGKLPSVLKTRDAMYGISDAFLGKLRDLYNELADPKLVQQLAREPSGRVMINIMTALAEHPEEYLRIADLVQQEYSFTEDHDKETVRAAARKHLADEGFTAYVQSIGQSVGYAFDAGFVKKMKALRDELDGVLVKEHRNPLSAKELTPLLQKIGRNDGLVIWPVEFDPLTGFPGTESIVDILASGLNMDKDRINAICEKHFPELKLKYQAEQHAKKMAALAAQVSKAANGMTGAGLPQDSRLDEIMSAARALNAKVSAMAQEVRGIANRTAVTIEDITRCAQLIKDANDVLPQIKELQERYARREKELREEMLRNGQFAPDFTGLAQALVAAAEKAGVDVQELYSRIVGSAQREAGSLDKAPTADKPEALRELVPMPFTGFTGENREFDEAPSVNAVAVSDDGRYIAVGIWADKISKVYIIDAKSGEIIGKPVEHDQPINSVVFYLDGEKFAVAGGKGNGTVYVYETKSGLAEGSWQGHKGYINRLVRSADGKKLVTGSSDGTARLVDMRTRKSTVIYTRRTQSGSVLSVAISPDGTRVALYDSDAGVCVLQDGAEKFLKDASGPLAYSPDGNYLACRYPGGFRIWDAKELKPIGDPVQCGSVRALAFSPDSRLIAWGGDGGTPYNGQIGVVSVKTQKPFTTTREVKKPVISITFSNDGQYFVAGAGDRQTGTPGLVCKLRIADSQERSAEITVGNALDANEPAPAELPAISDPVQLINEALKLVVQQTPGLNLLSLAGEIDIHGPRAPGSAGIDWDSIDWNSTKVDKVLSDGDQLLDLAKGVAKFSQNMEISPDGRSAYIVAEFGNELNILSFKRDPVTGALSDAQVVIEGGTDKPGWQGSSDKTKWSLRGNIGISPDGRRAYISDYHGIVSMKRDPATGKLQGNLRQEIDSGTQIPGCPTGAMWNIFSTLSFSPDGRHAYIMTMIYGSMYIVSIARNPISGKLGKARPLIKYGDTVPGLVPEATWDRFSELIISPDGSRAFIMNSGRQIVQIIMLERDPETEELSNARIIIRNGELIPGELDCGPALSPDGRQLYVGVTSDGKHQVLSLDLTPYVKETASSVEKQPSGIRKQLTREELEQYRGLLHDHVGTITENLRDTHSFDTDTRYGALDNAKAVANQMEKIIQEIAASRISSEDREAAWPEVYKDCRDMISTIAQVKLDAKSEELAALESRLDQAESASAGTAKPAEGPAALRAEKIGKISPLDPPLKGHTDGVRSVTHFEGLDGKEYLASGGFDKTLRIWQKGNDGNWIAYGSPLEGHTGGVSSVTHFKGLDGKEYLASGSTDETLRIWQKGNDGNWIAYGSPLEGHTGGVRSVTHFEGLDGKEYLASGSTDETLRIWQKGNDGNWIAYGSPLEGHTRYDCSVMHFEGLDGKEYLASGSKYNTLRIWQKGNDGNWIAYGSPLKGHTNDVLSVTYFKGLDGKEYLASGSGDKTIRIWEIKHAYPASAGQPQVKAAGAALPAVSVTPAGDANAIITQQLDAILQALSLNLAPAVAAVPQSPAALKEGSVVKRFKRGPLVAFNGDERTVILDGVIPIRRGKEISRGMILALKKRWEEISIEWEKCTNTELHYQDIFAKQQIVVALIGAGVISAEALKEWPSIIEDCQTALIDNPTGVDASYEVAVVLMNNREMTYDNLKMLKSKWENEKGNSGRLMIAAMIGAGRITDEALAAWPTAINDCRKELIWSGRSASVRSGRSASVMVSAILMSGRIIDYSLLNELKECFKSDKEEANKEVIAAMIGAGIIDNKALEAWPTVYEDCMEKLIAQEAETIGYEGPRLRHSNSARTAAALLMSGRKINRRNLESLRTTWNNSNNDQKEVIISLLGAGIIEDDALPAWPNVIEDGWKWLIDLAGSQGGNINWISTPRVAALLMSGREITKGDLKTLKKSWKEAINGQCAVITAIIGAGTISDEALEAWPTVFEDCWKRLIGDDKNTFVVKEGEEAMMMLMRGHRLTIPELTYLKKIWANADNSYNRTSLKEMIIAMIGASTISDEVRSAVWPELYESINDILMTNDGIWLYNYENQRYDEHYPLQIIKRESQLRRLAVTLMSYHDYDESVITIADDASPSLVIDTAISSAGIIRQQLAAVLQALSLNLAPVVVDTVKTKAGQAQNTISNPIIAQLSVAFGEVFAGLGMGAPAAAVEQGMGDAKSLITAGLSKIFAIMSGNLAEEIIDMAVPETLAEESLPAAVTDWSDADLGSLQGRLVIKNGDEIPGMPGKYWDVKSPPTMSNDGRRVIVMIDLDGDTQVLLLDRDPETGELSNARSIVKNVSTTPTFNADGTKTVVDAGLKAGLSLQECDSANNKPIQFPYEMNDLRGTPLITPDGKHMLATVRFDEGHGVIKVVQMDWNEADRKASNPQVIIEDGFTIPGIEGKRGAIQGSLDVSKDGRYLLARMYVYSSLKLMIFDRDPDTGKVSNGRAVIADDDAIPGEALGKYVSVIPSTFSGALSSVPEILIQNNDGDIVALRPTRSKSVVSLGRNVEKLVGAAIETIPFMKQAAEAGVSAAELLVKLFSGKDGEQLVSQRVTLAKYGGLLQDLPFGVKICVSAAPLSGLAHSPDCFVLATKKGSTIIIHRSLMDALREDLASGRKDLGFTLKDIIRHEREEEEYLKRNPGKTYEDYHAIAEKRDAALFEKSRQIVDGSIQAAKVRAASKVYLNDAELESYFGKAVLEKAKKEGRRFFIRKLDPDGDQKYIDRWKTEFENDRKPHAEQNKDTEFPWGQHLLRNEYGLLSEKSGDERLEGHIGFDWIANEGVWYLRILEAYYRNIGGPGKAEIPGVADLLFDFMLKQVRESGNATPIEGWVQTPGGKRFVQRLGFNEPVGDSPYSVFPADRVSAVYEKHGLQNKFSDKGPSALDAAADAALKTAGNTGRIYLNDAEVEAYFGSAMLEKARREGRRYFVRELDQKRDEKYLDEWQREFSNDQAANTRWKDLRKGLPKFSHLKENAYGLLSEAGNSERLEGHIDFDRLGSGSVWYLWAIEVYYKNIGGREAAELPGVADLLFDLMIKRIKESGEVAPIDLCAETPGSEKFVRRWGFHESVNSSYWRFPVRRVLQTYEKHGLQSRFGGKQPSAVDASITSVLRAANPAAFTRTFAADKTRAVVTGTRDNPSGTGVSPADAVGAIAPALAGEGIVFADVDAMEDAVREAGSRGMKGIGVAPRTDSDYGPVLLTVKIGEGDRPTSSVVVPVNGKDIELRVWKRDDKGAGGPVMLYYDGGLAAQGLNAQETKMLAVLAPLYIGAWVESNPHVQELLGMDGFTCAVYKTGNRDCADPAIGDELRRLKTTATEAGFDGVVLAFDAGNGAAENGAGPGGEGRKRIAGVFDVINDGMDPATELRMMGNAYKRKTGGQNYIGELPLSGVAFADVKTLLSRFDGWQAADAFIVRTVKDTEYSRLAAAARTCAAQGKRLVTYYRVGKGENLASARAAVLRRAKLGVSVIVDAREAGRESLPGIAAWIEGIAAVAPDAVSGLLLAEGESLSDDTLYAAYGIRKVMQVSPASLLDDEALNGIVNRLASEKGAKWWMDIGDAAAIEEQTYRIDDHRAYLENITERAKKLMKFANMFSVPDEMLEQCEGRLTDPGSWRAYVIGALRDELDKQLSGDPSYVFDRGRSAARHDKAVAGASLAGEMLNAVREYRDNGKNPDLSAAQRMFAGLRGKDGSYIAGYLYGVLENAAAATIDEQRPFIDPRHAVLQTHAVVELQLYLVRQGREAVSVSGPEGLGVLIKEINNTDAKNIPAPEPQKQLMERIRQLRLHKDTLTGSQVRDAVNGILNEYWNKMRNEPGHYPLVLTGLLDVLAIADREEKGLLQDIYDSGLESMPAVMKAINSAA